jgi:8-oxo-dGTP pyrophosphatase MutT (NUDIX family)
VDLIEEEGGRSLTVADVLTGFTPRGDAETSDLERMVELTATDEPWSRATPLHFTASALIVNPADGRVLLRWHERQQSWLQVGGHADPGETHPLAVALREGHEETGLEDLRPWPGAELIQVAVVPVAAGATEPVHQHADLRFVLATETPEAARPENPKAELRWLTIPEARRMSLVPNLLVTLDRVAGLLDGGAAR